MTTEAPDPQTLTSWHDAFQHHPIPAVRRLETQLRADLKAGREKVRGLVGCVFPVFFFVGASSASSSASSLSLRILFFFVRWRVLSTPLTPAMRN